MTYDQMLACFQIDQKLKPRYICVCTCIYICKDRVGELSLRTASLTGQIVVNSVMESVMTTGGCEGEGVELATGVVSGVELGGGGTSELDAAGVVLGGGGGISVLEAAGVVLGGAGGAEDGD